MKLNKNAKIIKLFLIIFLVTKELPCSKKSYTYILFLNQNSKIKYLLKIKTANQCSLTA